MFYATGCGEMLMRKTVGKTLSVLFITNQLITRMLRQWTLYCETCQIEFRILISFYLFHRTGRALIISCWSALIISWWQLLGQDVRIVASAKALEIIISLVTKFSWSFHKAIDLHLISDGSFAPKTRGGNGIACIEEVELSRWAGRCHSYSHQADQALLIPDLLFFFTFRDRFAVDIFCQQLSVSETN